MVNSRFHALFARLSGSDADVLERAYPGYRLERLYGALMTKLEWWCYGPVWLGRPLTRKAWRQEQVKKEEWEWLAANARDVLPGWHENLQASLRKGDLSKAEAFRLIGQGLSECVRQLSKSPVRQCVKTSGPTYERWKQEVKFPRVEVIRGMLEEIEGRMPGQVAGALLHGSLADGKVVDGFSDCDLTLMLKLPSDSGEGMMELAEWVMELNRWMLAYNPAMHHGPALLLEEEMGCASPVRLPPMLLRHGVWMGGDREIGYREDLFGRVAVFGVFERFFEQQIRFSTDVRSAFDAIWWTANTNILPCLLAQLMEGRSVWKGEIFEKAPASLPEEFHGLLGRLEETRRKIGKWVAGRLPEPVWPVREEVLLPGSCLAAYKQLLAMTPGDVEGVGLDEEMIRGGWRLWEYASGQALRWHRERIKEAGGEGTRLLAWPMRTTEAPRGGAMADYRIVRGEFVAAASAENGVKGVYEFGSVGCPGLSDLDMLVVLSREYQGVPKSLTIAGMSRESAAVMGHDPIFIGEDSVEIFGGVFPVFACRQLWGDARPVALSESFSEDVRAVLVSVMNILKYPRDILWLCKQPAVRWTTLLAYLNSFNHVSRCLEMIGVEVPGRVRRCVEMNAEVRERFRREGRATLGDLAAAIPVMLGGSVEMASVLERYWRERFRFLDQVLPAFRAEEMEKETKEALEAAGEEFPLEPPAIRLIGAMSTMEREDCLPRSEGFGKLEATLAPAAEMKRQFAERETRSGRGVSGYIRHPRFYAEPGGMEDEGPALGRVDQLRSPRFERFMAAMNCFAGEHGLRVITEWSKVWEYPWLWYRGLRQMDWRGKRLVDLGSELSPMPWFIAQLGARVTLVETHEELFGQWGELREKLGVKVDFQAVKDEKLPLADESVDVVTSFSVIEHQADKKKAVEEVARVLKPGGIFAVSFDICEPERGMRFPEWNGKALTMREFEEVVWNHPAFENTRPPVWNTQDMEAYLQWHRQSAAHHNYVTGAAVLVKRR